MSIKIENIDTYGWEAAIRGMRNPKNSWNMSDSDFSYVCHHPDAGFSCKSCERFAGYNKLCTPLIGENDLRLMHTLAKAGTDHGKFLRMITVTMDITAPLYWWSEYDTYKVGTVANSCSKMHKLLYKPFEMSDFSFDRLSGFKNGIINDKCAESVNVFEEVARPLVDTLNEMRDSYFLCDDEMSRKRIWYSILQLLPESYNQRRTIQMNYAVALNMYHARKNHKLDEWHVLCDEIKKLPYFEKICLED